MKQLKSKCLFAAAVLAGIAFSAQVACAQDTANKITVPLTDPSRPATVRAHLVSGSITVKAYDGKEIIVEANAGSDGDSDRGRHHHASRDEAPTEGMKRIPMTGTGLSVEAENNQVSISADSVRHGVDLTITVPVHTSLSLHTVNGGNISVTGVDGELDVNNVNGEVTLTNVSGSVVAHALNGRVLATFNRVDQKPMAFSSLNGNIDVTFPPDLKASVSMRTDNGEVFSDFDVKLQPNAPLQTVEDGRPHGGSYRVKIDKTVHGTINGGGPEIQFKNFNGNIYIRKAGGSK
ncbi:MAG TPA: DUF4097 family beta strand repeat-containing protein [Verrucomicrobiae bacterium]|jgi:hypothetical protein|nr:DUF4097 family beta strand repeat-containing protein [Verrucomicrobiae bacterium]